MSRTSAWLTPDPKSFRVAAVHQLEHPAADVAAVLPEEALDVVAVDGGSPVEAPVLGSAGSSASASRGLRDAVAARPTGATEAGPSRASSRASRASGRAFVPHPE